MNNPITEKTILLASKSPRRRALIEGLNIKFKIVEAEVEEIIPEGMHAEEVAEYLANLKSQIDIDLKSDEILLTADTIVILDNEVIGKPKDLAHAIEILQQLSGKTHSVISGVSLRDKNRKTSFSVHTQIEFFPLSQETIDYYVNNYEVLDKAGAYAIQEWIGMVAVKQIKGDFYNVMGLPISTIIQNIKEHF